jgi:3-isopropylmalate/(R)-2-methylmalate dehydratase large subunit
MAGKTLYDKLWDSHVVHDSSDGSALIYIDRHLVHEVTSPQAFDGLRLASRKPWRLSANLAVADHNVPTTDRTAGIADPISRAGGCTRCQLRGIRHHRIQDERRAPGYRPHHRP